MIFKVLRFIGRNFGSLFTAAILGLIVWISAVTAADPNQELVYPRQVAIEQIGKDPKLIVVGSIPATERVTLNAPRSVQEQLAGDETALRVWIDLTNLEAGEHTVAVHVQPNRSPVRVVKEEPAEIHLVLEPLTTRTLTVTLNVQGQPAMGYKAGTPVYETSPVLVSGAESLVSKVIEIQAVVNMANASQSVDASLTLTPVDNAGKVVDGLTLTPDVLNVKIPINLLGGYRNVIVKVVSSGNVADGYKLTGINAIPPNVVVFSGDPQQLADLPGFIETKPLDLTGATSDITTTVPLNMPPGISVVNDQKALVHIGISPVISSLTVSLQVEVKGLAPGLEAHFTPTSVDVVLTGPVPILNTLKPSDIRAIIDVTGKDIGVYQVGLSVSSLPADVQTESILPSPVEVTLVKGPTPTRTMIPTPGPSQTPGPSSSQGPSPTPGPSQTPKP
jgi:YbbR domain-containing protein